MRQSTLKVNELDEDINFTQDSEKNNLDPEIFTEKFLLVDESTESELDEDEEDELLIENVTQRVMDATQLYLSEIGYSPLLTAEEEIYFARRVLCGDESSRRRMIESNLRLVVKNFSSLYQSWSAIIRLN